MDTEDEDDLDYIIDQIQQSLIEVLHELYEEQDQAPYLINSNEVKSLKDQINKLENNLAFFKSERHKNEVAMLGPFNKESPLITNKWHPIKKISDKINFGKESHGLTISELEKDGWKFTEEVLKKISSGGAIRK
jgi:hypothetical protein